MKKTTMSSEMQYVVLIIFILGNMLISIMVQIKFDRHIIYKMCVLDGV